MFPVNEKFTIIGEHSLFESAMRSRAPRSLISGKVALNLTAYLLSLELWWSDRMMNYVRPIDSIYWRHPIGTELVSCCRMSRFGYLGSYQSSTLKGKYS